MSPEQSRQQLIAGQALHYRLRYSSRRSIGLRIDADGLLITAPHRCPERDIEAALSARAAWIFRHLQQRPAASAPLGLLQQGSVLYHGQALALQVNSGRAAVAVTSDTLLLTLPAGSTDAQATHILSRWFQQQARRQFAGRVFHFAALLGVATPLLRLTSARTRWGSCNQRGEIRLHWRLLQAPPAILDYVIVHELAHILELNHSPRFWAHVERAYPDWRTAREYLREHGQRYWAW